MKHKFIFIIPLIIALFAVLTVSPLAIQSGYYDGQSMLHILGAQYQVELGGIGDDAIVLFDTRSMYWFDDEVSDFDSIDVSTNEPDVSVLNTVTIDSVASIVYNDLTLQIEHPDFPVYDTHAVTLAISDRFTLSSSAPATGVLGIHLSPIYNIESNEYFIPPGEIVQGQITLYALNEYGEVYDQLIGRDDLIVGSTYDLTERLRTFTSDVVGGIVQYYWIEYEGSGVVPTFTHNLTFNLGIPQSDVHVVDFATDITYPEYVDYDDFDLLRWISTAVDGFMRAPLFVLGDFTVTLGAVLAVGITVPIFVAFLRRYAGG